MTLTEQHRSGKLERNRDYFVKVNDKVVSIYLDGDNDFIYYGHIIKPEVLAAVPTYKEWQNLKAKLEENTQLKEQLESETLAKNEGAEIVAELKSEIKKLKDLLKRVNEHFEWVDGDDSYYIDEDLWDDIKKIFGIKPAKEIFKVQTSADKKKHSVYNEDRTYFGEVPFDDVLFEMVGFKGYVKGFVDDRGKLVVEKKAEGDF